MAQSKEISAIRTILPVGLGIAIGLVIGAAALANVPVIKAKTEAAPAAQTSSIKPLSTAPGISFARINRDGERCFAARQTQASEMICTH